MGKPIVTPLLDKRDYKSVKLNNGIEAILVADKSSTLSSASLAVHAGYFDDPEDFAGLAHFCEHLMFLGTKKYPQENGYKQYISTNGGMSNAYTTTVLTNYFFQIKNSAFPEAVDRFAQFFIEPLFDPDCKDREINAVHAEHEKNKQQDMWRISEVSKQNVNKKHPYSKFGTGNKLTLDKPEVRDRLLEFHKNEYCASKMKLVLMGSDMEELESLLKVFEDIQNKNLAIPVLTERVLDPEASFLEIVPVSETRYVSYEFEVPGLSTFTKNNELWNFTHLLGHESPGSLYWDLKQKGWIDTVGTGISMVSSEATLFVVQVQLTTEGVQHTDEIGEALFEYLAMLKSEGSQEWVFDEAKNIRQTQFDYKETPGQIMMEASQLATNFAMRQCEASEVISIDYLYNTYSAEAEDKLLALLTPDNVRVTIVAPENKDKCKLVEEHYGTKYAVGKLSDETVDKLTKAVNLKGSKRFHLPRKNPYIAEDFSLVNTKKADVTLGDYYKPQELLPTLFYFPDYMFESPKGFIAVGFDHPSASNTVRNSLLTRLATSLWMDATEPYSYDATVAQLDLTIKEADLGFSVQVSGFSHKLEVLLNEVYETLQAEINPERFPALLDNLKRTLTSDKFENAFRAITNYASAELNKNKYTLEEYLASLEEKDITLEEVTSHMKTILAEFSPRVLVAGNLSEPKAREIHKNLLEVFPKSGERANESYKLGSKPVVGSKIQKLDSLNPDDLDNCVLYYLESDEVEKARLLASIIKEPAFYFLRTQKQLGYATFAQFLRNFSTAGVRFITQSAFHADDVKTLMDEFLTVVMVGIFDKMTTEEFDDFVAGYIATVSKPPKSFLAQAKLVWSRLCSTWDVSRDMKDVEVAKSATLDEIKKFYTNLIGPKKRSLCIEIISGQESKRFDLDKEEEKEEEKK